MFISDSVIIRYESAQNLQFAVGRFFLLFVSVDASIKFFDLAFNHRTYTLRGQNFQQQAVINAAVNDVNGFYSVASSLEC